MLILYFVLYGVAIDCVIFNGLQDSIQLIWFVCISILVIARTFSAAITLLVKEQDNGKTRTK